MAAPPRHTFEEHTGEVRLRVEAPTLNALFAEAGRALAGLMAVPDDRAPPGPPEGVALHARDRAALLVAWLNELVYRTETRGLVYTDLQVELIGDAVLRAQIRGVPPAEARTAVKAATLHDVRIEESEGGVMATVVLDV